MNTNKKRPPREVAKAAKVLIDYWDGVDPSEGSNRKRVGKILNGIHGLPPDIARDCALTVEVALRVYASKPRVDHAVKEAFALAKDRTDYVVTPASPTSRVFEDRELNKLEDIGIRTIAAVLEMSDEDLASKAGFGWGTVERIAQQLGKHGLKLRCEILD